MHAGDIIIGVQTVGFQEEQTVGCGGRHIWTIVGHGQQEAATPACIIVERGDLAVRILQQGIGIAHFHLLQHLRAQIAAAKSPPFLYQRAERRQNGGLHAASLEIGEAFRGIVGHGLKAPQAVERLGFQKTEGDETLQVKAGRICGGERINTAHHVLPAVVGLRYGELAIEAHAGRERLSGTLIQRPQFAHEPACSKQ